MKLALFGDIHFGAKGNSKTFNEYCCKFVTRLVEYAKSLNLDGIVFLGDWHDSRDEIQVATLNYSHKALQELNDSGIPVKMILGNHDLYFRNSRKLNSIPFIKQGMKIEQITEPKYDVENGFLYIPWLTEDENFISIVNKYSPKYVFCHAELPGFQFNKLSSATGIFDETLYQGPEKIFSGHYHQRQEKGNVVYIGNCFCSTFADLDEEENRGFCVLDTDTGKYEYVQIPGMPVYKKIKYSEFMGWDYSSFKNLYLKIVVDEAVNNEKLIEIRKRLEAEDNIISVSFENTYTETAEVKEEQVEEYETIDDLVLNSIDALKDLESSYDKELLKDLFKNS